jgi:hypothetical protein
VRGPQEILQLVADEMTAALARVAEVLSGDAEGVSQPASGGEVDMAALEAEIRGQGSYTVVGFWPETRERYHEWVDASGPRQAEDLARMTAVDKGGVLWVCGVYEGKIEALDTYALFIDPDQTTAIDG